MPIPDPVIYLKKTLKSLWSKPSLKTLFSSFRYYSDWREHLLPGRNSVADSTPWMSFAAIHFLRTITRDDMRVFEYGSGGSTMFWTSRVQEVVSVEHDLSWYNIMREELKKHPSKNVKYILAEPVPDPSFQKKRFENP